MLYLSPWSFPQLERIISDFMLLKVTSQVLYFKKGHCILVHLIYKVPFIRALCILSLLSENVFPHLMYLLLFSVLPLSIKIMYTSKWGMKTLAYSWKAEGPCHRIWLAGHLCRNELWEESRRQCSFTGNIWTEIYKILGEGLLLPRWLPKFLIPALWKWNWGS